jgi:hypothetical protein
MPRILNHPENKLRTQVDEGNRYMLQRKMCASPSNPKGRLRARCSIMWENPAGIRHSVRLNSTEFWQLWESTRPLKQLYAYWSTYKKPHVTANH